MASSLNNPAWVEWMTQLMGGVSRKTYAATFPPDLFYCLLDELPLHLIPQRYRRARRALSRDDLYLNPDCILCGEGEIPHELESRRELLAGFALQGTIAWVRNPAIGNLLPFWLGPQIRDLIEALQANETLECPLLNEAIRLLCAANILVSAESLQESALYRETRIAEAARRFRERDYAPIGELIHPFHIAALRRYYRHKIRTGAIRLGDGQSPRRYVAYNERVARFFHHEIAATMSALAGELVKPSYVYLASYLSGAELKKHTDREQCEFSVTFCLDFSPEPRLATPWPIRLDTARGTTTVFQALGDGLAYRGTRLPHYRDRLSEGQTSTSIFFHYVSADFTGSLD